MILYHGSNTTVEKPRIIRQNRFLDFGFGFYTTTNESQAANFAEKVTAKRKTGNPVVNIYDFDETGYSECALLKFDSADSHWLDFVLKNRSGMYTGEKFDLIYGAVANDSVYQTLALYTAGILSEDQTLEALRIRSLYNQLVFTTDKSLGFLHFIRSKNLWKKNS